MNAMKTNDRRLRRIGAYLLPYWKSALFVLALTLSIALLNAVEPLIYKAIFDRLGDGVSKLGDNPYHFLFRSGAALVALLLVKELVEIVTNNLYWRLQLKVKFDLLGASVARIFNLSMNYHQNETGGIGALMTKLDRGINGFSQVLFDVSFQILPSLAYLICTLVFMLSLSWKLSLVAVAFTPIPAVIGLWAAEIASRREKSLLGKWMSIYARLQQALGLIKTVKAFGMEDGECSRFLGGVKDANQLVARGVKQDSLFGGAKNLVTGIGRLAVFLYGGVLLVRGEITVGTLVAFITYTGALYAPVLGLAGFYEAFRKARVYLDTIFDIIDTRDQIEESPNAITLQECRGNVGFESVCFAYGGTSANEPSRPQAILKGVSFAAEPGRMVALVGPSGSGKSTIMDLICRFYDPISGAVTLDGIDVRQLSQKSLRSHVSMVLQNTLLFSDTIWNNIKCGRPDATDEEVIAAAKAANAHQFIIAKEKGYDTEVGERGDKLSGGERQRIAIARAILKDPAVFIFDEATSNLDSESEALIQDSIDRLAKKKTVFVVAHRLSTVKNADQILVLQDGRIRERGRHAELISANGIYRALVEKQDLGLQGMVNR